MYRGQKGEIIKMVAWLRCQKDEKKKLQGYRENNISNKKFWTDIEDQGTNLVKLMWQVVVY